MGLLTPTRRVYHRWRLVLQLYDGRACPDCGAIVCGREDRRVHREKHMADEQWRDWAEKTIAQIARYAGMQVVEAVDGQLEHQGDDYQRVDLTGTDDDEEEYDDD